MWRQTFNLGGYITPDSIIMTNHVWKYRNHEWSGENPLRVTNVAGRKRRSLFVGSSIIHVNTEHEYKVR